jgi:hypothetical protein
MSRCVMMCCDVLCCDVLRCAAVLCRCAVPLCSVCCALSCRVVSSVVYHVSCIMLSCCPPTPSLQAMEHQLGSLETRLARREQELARVVDESKASGHLERLRLQSIHEQVRAAL